MNIKNKIGTAVLAMSTLAASAVALPTATAHAATSVTINNKGDVTINGTDAAEHVWLRNNTDGQLIVRIVTGQFYVDHVIDDLTRDLVVKLKGGNDTFQIFGTGHLDLRRLTVVLGEGDNTVEMMDIEVAQKLRIVDGSGSASMNLYDIEVHGDVSVDLGGGQNLLSTTNSTLDRKLTITAKKIGSMDVRLGSIAIGKGLTVRGGDQVDMVRPSNVSVDGATLIDLKGGNDTFIAQSSAFDKVTIRMGAGSDFAVGNDSEFAGRFLFRGDAGRDLFGAHGSHFGAAATFNGGSDIDDYRVPNSSFARNPKVISFEA